MTTNKDEILIIDKMKGLWRKPGGKDLVSNFLAELDSELKTERVLIEAVKLNPMAIKHIENPSREVCMAAVIRDVRSFELIKEPDYNICLSAVKRRGEYLKLIKNQTNEICLFAVRNNGMALKHVKNKTDGLCLEAVKSNPKAIQYINEQTEELCLTAVRISAKSLQYVKKQTDKICLTAVTRDWSSIRLVENKNEDICIAAVTGSLHAIPHVPELTYKIMKAAVEADYEAIYILHDQPDDLCKIAIGKNIVTMKGIREPSDSVIDYYFLKSGLYDFNSSYMAFNNINVSVINEKNFLLFYKPEYFNKNVKDLDKYKNIDVRRVDLFKSFVDKIVYIVNFFNEADLVKAVNYDLKDFFESNVILESSELAMSLKSRAVLLESASAGGYLEKSGKAKKII